MKIKNFSEFLNEFVYVQAQAQAPQAQVQPVQDQALQSQPQTQVQPQTQPVQPQVQTDPKKANKKINFTYLDKDSNVDKLRQICETAKIPENLKYISGVVVWPEFISEAKKYLEDTDIKIVTVISFPDGTAKRSENMKMLQKAVAEKVDEVYIGMNHNKISQVSIQQDKEQQEKMFTDIQNEIRSYVEYCKERSITIGIIIEMEALGDAKNISKAAEICKNANVDFIMTSTGMYNKNTAYTFETKLKDVTDVIIPMIQGMDDININFCGGVNSTDNLMLCLNNGKVQRITSSMEPQTLLNTQAPPKYQPEPSDELIVQQNPNV
jgi:deoxyribose-phosphate aldolase